MKDEKQGHDDGVAEAFAELDRLAQDDPVVRAIRRHTAACVLYGAVALGKSEFLKDLARGLVDSLALDLEAHRAK